MDQTYRPVPSSGRIIGVDVSQLDKINAIPNKTTDTVLVEGLCQEDRLFLNALMDDDSPDSDDDDQVARRNQPTWSPLTQTRSMKIHKKIKRLRPSYAVTLSLEDISYIRPSWGMSKGIKRIDLNKARKADKKSDKVEGARAKDDPADEPKLNSITGPQLAYRCFLFFLISSFLLLTLLSYAVDLRRFHDRIDATKMHLRSDLKLLEFFRPASPTLEPVLRLRFAQGIPSDLKPDECTCEIFDEQTKLYQPNVTLADNCHHCLDWESRANLQVRMNKLDRETFCYNIKWQSYDALRTPLTDCIEINEEQWFGLGDLYTPLWPLNRLESDWTILVSNLSVEFNANDPKSSESRTDNSRLEFGSMAKFSLISAYGVHVNRLKTDFQAYIQIKRDPKLSSGKLVCLTATCTETCSQMWTRFDNLDELRTRNNVLEYSICTSTNWRNLVARQIPDKSRLVLSPGPSRRTDSTEPTEISAPLVNAKESGRSVEEAGEIESKVERLSSRPTNLQNQSYNSSNTMAAVERDLPEGVGLIERTIFATSPDFFPVLDGQTLRQYVDSIVKMGLKTSSILLVDTRWQTYVGSLKLDVAIFPKAKLLFDILHNKGFKVLLSVRPYIDTVIGVNNINQLLESGRLYTARYKKGELISPSDYTAPIASKVETSVMSTVIRRKSLFRYENETVFLDRENSEQTPYLCSCRESRDGHCVLLDVTTGRNRAWLIDAIKRSNLLTQEVDGIQLGGAHPNGHYWEEHYKAGLSEIVRSLMKEEHLYTVPQWTGDFGYIQLAPRACTWDGLRSTINSVLNLGIVGYSLVHPGSVWGDIKSAAAAATGRIDVMDPLVGERTSDEELYIRWLQVSVFMPLLQFNNMAPIERYGLQDMLRNLVRVRKLYIVPELKKYLPPTALIAESMRNGVAQSATSPYQSNSGVGQQQGSASTATTKLPLIRTIWMSNESGESIVAEQFSVGPDIVVAPILNELQRQRDIYLPSGFWRDELRQMNIRGGKWLRNYPVELNEIAWFTRTKR